MENMISDFSNETNPRIKAPLYKKGNKIHG